MARISNIFKEDIKPADLHPKRVTHWIHYTKLVDNEAQYRFGRNETERKAMSEEVRTRQVALADLIEIDGEVLQDLLVRKIGDRPVRDHCRAPSAGGLPDPGGRAGEVPVCHAALYHPECVGRQSEI